MMRSFDFELGASLRLDAADPGFSDQLFEVLQADRADLLGFMPALEELRNPDAVARFLRSTQETGPLGPFAHERLLLEGERIIGGFGLHDVDWLRRSSSIGYWLRPSARRRGLARRAVDRLCRFGFQVMRLERIEARCDVANHRGLRVALAAGFQIEGTLRGALGKAPSRRDAVVLGRLYSDPMRESTARTVLDSPSGSSADSRRR